MTDEELKKKNVFVFVAGAVLLDLEVAYSHLSVYVSTAGSLSVNPHHTQPSLCNILTSLVSLSLSIATILTIEIKIMASTNNQHTLLPITNDSRPTLTAPHPNPSLRVSPNNTLTLVPDSPVYAPQRGECLVHIKATGICGSDVHFWKAGRIGSLVVQDAYTLGHEPAGVVVQVGEGVTHLKPGDKVAVEPGVSCGTCWLCKEGKYNLCEAVAFAGVWPFGGTLTRYHVHPAAWLHKLPDEMSFTQGALLEPLSVILAALRQAKLQLGQPLVICGAGPIGLTALLASRASGAHPIVITDVEPKRLAFAKELVPQCLTYQVDVSSSGGGGAQDNARRIRAMFGAKGGETEEGEEYPAPPVVIECTGAEASVCTAAFTVRRGGRVVVVGVGREVMNNLPFMHLSLSEVSFCCLCVFYENCFID